MVKAIDNLVTDAPLRDIRLAIGPAEALLRDIQSPGAVSETTALEEPVTPAPEPVSKEQLVEHEQAGYQRGREEAVVEYEAQINHLRAELEQKNAADLPGILGKIETEVNGSLNQRLQSLESELVEFATEAAIRLVNGLPISNKIVESSIQDALGHCDNDAEVAVYLNPEDLKLLKEPVRICWPILLTNAAYVISKMRKCRAAVVWWKPTAASSMAVAKRANNFCAKPLTHDRFGHSSIFQRRQGLGPGAVAVIRHAPRAESRSRDADDRAGH